MHPSVVLNLKITSMVSTVCLFTPESCRQENVLRTHDFLLPGRVLPGGRLGSFRYQTESVLDCYPKAREDQNAVRSVRGQRKLV